MLVVSRKEREAVLIGDEIVITVTQIKGKTVRISVDAPRQVSIARLDVPRRRPAGRSAERATGVAVSVAK